MNENIKRHTHTASDSSKSNSISLDKVEPSDITTPSDQSQGSDISEKKKSFENDPHKSSNKNEPKEEKTIITDKLRLRRRTTIVTEQEIEQSIKRDRKSIENLLQQIEELVG